MKIISSLKIEKPFYIVLNIFFLCIICELIFILILNSSKIIYTVDDSYIHLALAENIYRGHYGINMEEYSCPSSSIPWPFLLAPFSRFGFGYLVPFIFNLISSIGSVFIVWLFIKLVFLQNFPESKKDRMGYLLLILLIPVFNLIGSIFTGMEHSLQVFLTILIIYGLISSFYKEHFPNWLYIAIIIAPLIRYENLSISLASLLFLYQKGKKKNALISFGAIVILLTAFSVFLLSLGLEALPISILQKGNVTSSGGIFYSIIENIKINTTFERRCVVLLAYTVVLILILINGNRKKEERFLAGCMSAAILMHIAAGKSGRYIVYLWSASILTFLFLYREGLIRFILKYNFLKTAFYFSTASIIFSYSYIYLIIITPLASNNIYEQQYQIHRFAKDYYKKRVAVNDLGYTSFQNDNYVLDLAGLGSMEVYKEKKDGNNYDWMNRVMSHHMVEVAIIYRSWFPNIPPTWNKAAELYLGKKKYSPADSVVSIYAVNKESLIQVQSLLKKFGRTLPAGIKLIEY
ncbi:MAG: hypothetical protein ACM34M_11620 [Ignavibacteria bacterium]